MWRRLLRAVSRRGGDNRNPRLGLGAIREMVAQLDDGVTSYAMTYDGYMTFEGKLVWNRQRTDVSNNPLVMGLPTVAVVDPGQPLGYVSCPRPRSFAPASRGPLNQLTARIGLGLQGFRLLRKGRHRPTPS